MMLTIHWANWNILEPENEQIKIKKGTDICKIEWKYFILNATGSLSSRDCSVKRPTSFNQLKQLESQMDAEMWFTLSQCNFLLSESCNSDWSRELQKAFKASVQFYLFIYFLLILWLTKGNILQECCSFKTLYLDTGHGMTAVVGCAVILSHFF